MEEVLLYVAGGLSVVWGTSHLAVTRPMVEGFGDISRENRLYFIQEWVAEGVAIVFVGLLVVLVTAIAGAEGDASLVIYLTTAGFLLVVAVLTAVTGARTPVLPFKICPFLLGLVAALLVLGGLL